MRNSFLFYSSYYEAISELPDNEQGAVYKAIIDYGIAKTEPDLKGIANALFKLIKPTIDAALLRYDTNVENGKKGGRPPVDKSTETQRKPNGNPTETQTYPNNNPELTQEQPENNRTITQPITQSEPNTKPNGNLDIDMDIDIDKEIDFKLVNKNIFNNYESAGACERVREKNQEQRKPYLSHFNEYFIWCYSDNFKNVGYEIIDTIIEAREQAESEKGLTFKQKHYNKDKFIQEIIKIDNDKFRNIVAQVYFKEDINNRPLYILGCVLNAASDPKAKFTAEQLDEFVRNGG